MSQRKPKPASRRKPLIGRNPFEAAARTDDASRAAAPTPKDTPKTAATRKPAPPAKESKSSTRKASQKRTTPAPRTQPPRRDAASPPVTAPQERPVAPPLEPAPAPAVASAEPTGVDASPADVVERRDEAAPEPAASLGSEDDAGRAEAPSARTGGAFEVARELLSADYYVRQLGRLGMRNRSEDVDEFGYDPKFDERLRGLWDGLYAGYFRVRCEGVENVPARGRALVVANHSGALPYDAMMLKTALRREHPEQRLLRWLIEDHVFHMPFAGPWLNRLGAVRACQENAERMLRNDALVAVFPEGHKGQGRLHRERYELQRFGRGGFIRLCLRTGAPIVPCAIVGAEDGMPLLHRAERLGSLFGVPFVPVTPTFPWLGPLGLLPAPTRWTIAFGAPIELAPHGPADADDDALVGRLAERVRSAIQDMLHRAVGARRSVWFG